MPRANNAHWKQRVMVSTRALQRKLYRAAKQSGNRRFHALYDKVCRSDFLARAWSAVASKGGAPGVDGVSIEAIRSEGVVDFLRQLQAELRSGSYTPLPVRRVTIPKRSGGERHLGVPAVRDRVVQMAVKLVIEPVFEADFLPVSFGFRPKRSAHQARERVRAGMYQNRWVVDADIKGFFDHLDHGYLMALVRERISDRRVLGLIKVWLRSGVMDGETLLHPEAGTPQGGVISPLLANIYLNHLDTRWQKCCRRIGQLTRYADDLVILCRTRRAAMTAMERLRVLLAELKLELNEDKTRIVNLHTAREGFDFLGYHLRMVPSRRNRRIVFAACWPSRSAVAAARERIRALTPTDRIGLPAIMVVEQVNRFLRGWGAYFRQGNSTRQFHHIDTYAFERVAVFIARKHGARTWKYGMAALLESRTRLGLIRLAGTVRYPSAHAAG